MIGVRSGTAAVTTADSVRGWARRRIEMARKQREIDAAIEQEERAKRKVLHALADESLMKDVREAQRLEDSGEKGEPWPDVKKRLGLV